MTTIRRPRRLTGGGMPVDIWSRFMKAAHQGLPAADLPGMAGRTIDPAPPRRADAGSPQAPSPRCCRRRRPRRWRARTTCGRRAAPPLAPARPPAVGAAAAACPRRGAFVRARSARRRRVPRRSRPHKCSAPSGPPASPRALAALAGSARAAICRRAAAAAAPATHEPSFEIPRPPGAVGTQEARAQPLRRRQCSGSFFDNIFGRR